MGLYAKPPKPPDYKPLADAQVAVGKEQLDIQREQLTQARADAEWNRTIAQPIIDESLRQMKEQAQFAREERDRYNTTYRPIEDQFTKDALAFDTPERQEAEAGRAISAVGQAFDANTAAARRQLSRFGIDPSMLRAGALELQSSLSRATAQAQAGTDARRRVEDVGRSLEGEVINLGRGLPSTVANSYNSAVQGGQGANSTGLNTAAGAASGAQSTLGWGQLGLSGYQGAVNTLNSGYQNNLDYFSAKQAGPMAVLGAVSGIASSALSGRFGGGKAEGGVVRPEESPSRGAIPDDVNTRLTAGEYVFPPEVVRWKGEEFFEKLKASALQAQAQTQETQRQREGVLA